MKQGQKQNVKKGQEYTEGKRNLQTETLDSSGSRKQKRKHARQVVLAVPRHGMYAECLETPTLGDPRLNRNNIDSASDETLTEQEND